LAATQRNALCLGPRKPRVDAFTDHAALEFSKDAAHLEHRAARWRARGERLLVQVKRALALATMRHLFAVEEP
jgi:hypothetical protein